MEKKRENGETWRENKGRGWNGEILPLRMRDISTSAAEASEAHQKPQLTAKQANSTAKHSRLVGLGCCVGHLSEKKFCGRKPSAVLPDASFTRRSQTRFR